MIIRLEPIYTGGNSYIYTGKLNTGEYFLAADDYEDTVWLLDTDPYKDFDDCTYDWWQEAHTTRTLDGKEAFDFFFEIYRKAYELGDMPKADIDLRHELLLNEYPAEED